MCLEENSNGGDDRMMELDTIFDTISMFPITTTTTTTTNTNTNDEHNNNNGNNTAGTTSTVPAFEKALEAFDRGLLLLQKQGLGSGAYVKSFLHNGYQISLNVAASQATPQEVSLQATSTVSSSNTTCATATATATTSCSATTTAIKNNTNTRKYEYYEDLARSYLQQELIAVQSSEGIGSYRGIDIERTLQWHGWG